jgi:hypothetical protein
MLPNSGHPQNPSTSESQDSTSDGAKFLLPIEVEFYIEADGTVVFADLAAELVPLAQELNPDQPLVCDVPQSANDTDPAEADA